METIKKLERQSNFELLRIILMLLIVLHHYCVNSSFPWLIYEHLLNSNSPTANMLLIQFASFGGKMGVNGFFIISGYFMISGSMKVSKVIRLISTVFFYNVVVFIFLSALGYQYSYLNMIEDIVPLVFKVPYNFIATYLFIYLVSDVLNKCLKLLSQKELLYTFAVLGVFFCVLGTFFVQNTFTYFGWGLTMYGVGAYIRLYPLPDFFNKKKNLLFMFFGGLAWIWSFILFADYKGKMIDYSWQYLQTDGNKMPVLIMAIAIVLLFKNITIPNNKVINTIAASCLGVFLIHANSLNMIFWMWNDCFDNKKYIDSSYLWAHMIFAVVSVYVVCTIIDYLRIKFLEDPLFNKLEKRKKS